MELSRFLFIATVFLIANCSFSQEIIQDSTQVAKVFEPKWSFGAQLFQGIEFHNYNDSGVIYQGDSDHKLAIGLHTDYQWHENHSARTELNLTTGYSYTIASNFQYEWHFFKKWSIYGGVGFDFNTSYNYTSAFLGAQKDVVPTGMIGVRYKASRWITLDLRYQRDLTKRFEVPSCPANSFRHNNYNVMLGIQVNF